MQLYTVVSGDSLGKIAAKFGTTVAAIMAANSDITNPNLIEVDQEINIPVAAPAQAGAPQMGPPAPVASPFASPFTPVISSQIPALVAAPSILNAPPKAKTTQVVTGSSFSTQALSAFFQDKKKVMMLAAVLAAAYYFLVMKKRR